MTASRLQTLPAKSTTQAEIIALCDAIEDALWIRHLLQELGQSIVPIVYCDNQPAIRTLTRNQLGRNNKHIAVKYHFVKYYLDNHEIDLRYIPTNANLADQLTKPLTGRTLQYQVANTLYVDNTQQE